MNDLQTIADDVWRYWLDRDLGLQLKAGVAVEHLPDITFDAAERDAAFARTILQRLDDVSPENEDERLTAAVLRWGSERAIDDVPLFWYRSPITPNRTPLFTVHNVVSRMNDAQHLLDEMPRFVDDLLGVLREQERRGILLPKAEIPVVRDMLAALARSLSPEVERLLAYVDDDYAARAPDGVGMSQYPGGAEAYRAFVRQETTTDLTPEEIHEIGLREIARIDRELDALRQDIGFSGSLAELRRFLKTDRRFFATTPEEVAARLMSHVRRIEPQVPRFFARTPKAPYRVARLDAEFEGGSAFGYFQVPTEHDPFGTYYFNGSTLHERNLLWAAGLIAHELVPGHHFQLCLQAENESLPMIRREGEETAYCEGWGEYASYLGAEMGLYDDPYDRAGRLMQDAMLSARLVVDTGMNALGWPRERAGAYLREHTLLSETEIAAETLRYAVDMPAQALAYKIGALKIIELRELARGVDVRQFHEWIIGSGSLPLPLLEEHVRHELDALRSTSST